MIVTIDGPAAGGKSTAARRLAQRLGVPYLDTGAMYRAVTLAAMRDGIDLEDHFAVARLAAELAIDLAPDTEGGELAVVVNGQDVTEAIRDNDVSRNAHHVAGNSKVRTVLVKQQRSIGAAWGDFVTEGRDQGTVVFPDAELKVYLDASEDVRARRRREELARRGRQVPLEQVREEMRRRDERDRTRAIGPLKPADDAVVVDTSELDIEGTVDRLEELVRRRRREG